MCVLSAGDFCMCRAVAIYPSVTTPPARCACRHSDARAKIGAAADENLLID